jgi:hypothetical protein
MEIDNISLKKTFMTLILVFFAAEESKFNVGLGDKGTNLWMCFHDQFWTYRIYRNNGLGGSGNEIVYIFRIEHFRRFYK